MERAKQEMIGVITVVNLLVMNVFGVFTPLVYMVLVLMLMDLVTRVYAASVRQDERAESRKVLQGLYRKMGLCFLILLSLILDRGLKEIANNLGIHICAKIMFTAFTLAWLFIRELISNLENLQWAGIELPTFIVKAITLTEEKVNRVGESMMVNGSEGDKEEK